MKEDIYKAVPEHFVMRMRNWAWTNAGGGQYVPSSLCALISARSDSGTQPTLIGEAEDTGRALAELPVRYRQAVALFWQFEGHPLAWFARRSGVGVDPRTFQKRVMLGHEMLRAVLARHAERAREYREALKKRLLIA